MKRATLAAVAAFAAVAATAATVRNATEDWMRNRITAATNATLTAANDYTDKAVAGAVASSVQSVNGFTGKVEIDYTKPNGSIKYKPEPSTTNGNIRVGTLTHSFDSGSLSVNNENGDQLALPSKRIEEYGVYVPSKLSAYTNDAGFIKSEEIPEWAKAPAKPTYTASEVGSYSTGEVDNILQGYLPLDYFRDGQTIPMYWGDGTKLCDFGANWLGILVNTVDKKPDDADIPPAVSNIVTTALVRERLGVYLYVGADGGIYVHTNED